MGQVESISSYLGRIKSTKVTEKRPEEWALVPDALAPDVKQHLIDYYAEVKVERTIRNAYGQTFDFVEMHSQPAARHFDRPPVPPIEDAPSPMFAALVDAMGFGSTQIPDGTVPLLRPTLEQLTRFRSLADYLTLGMPKRGPSGSEAGGDDKLMLAASPHRYAYGSQQVACLGGTTFMSLCKPTVAGAQILSLSQIWCKAGISPGQMLQTVEAGWQVCPSNSLTNSPDPFFFIYWNPSYGTAPSFNNADGNFYVTSNKFPIGGTIGQTSSPGGLQYEIDVAYRLLSGDWWLYVGGVALGVWKGSLFNGGPLGTGCEEIVVGGETAGVGSYPPMGSGTFANTGFGQAAYHRSITYRDLSGADVAATMQITETTPSEYTMSSGPPAPAGHGWGRYVYFGGPGGN